MTGKQIREVINQQWQKSPTMLQISGFNYTWDENIENRIKKI
jgi:5'-nucleotidase